MNVGKMFFLKDVVEDSVDGVIISGTSTKEDVQIAIDSVRSKEDWTFEDIEEALPDDCRVYTLWCGEIENVWY